MTTEDIKQAVSEFATAAKNAIDAGFDGVEIHAANGYLLDRFTQDVSNQRTDKYGGSVENRSRFVHEIMKVVVEAVGPTRVGLRLSPWSTFQGMKMADPIPQFTDLIHKAKHLDLAYLHLVESRIAGADDAESAGEGLDFAYEIWDRPILVAGGYQAANAQKLVDENTPIKTSWIREGLELNAYDRSTFYTNLARGYVDYQFSPEYLASTKVQAAVA
ncbi:NADPH2 dehydrogenase chain OYE2 [Apiospora arundinis]